MVFWFAKCIIEQKNIQILNHWLDPWCAKLKQGSGKREHGVVIYFLRQNLYDTPIANIILNIENGKLSLWDQEQGCPRSPHLFNMVLERIRQEK